MEEKLPTKEDFDQKLQQVKSNDSALTSVNLNNLTDAKPEWAIEFVDALAHNTTVTALQMVNCQINTEGGKKFAELLKSNKTLTDLNIETNKIGPEGIKAIADALEENTTLKEIKLTNQAQPTGAEGEKALAKALEKNTTLQRCTITIKDASSRNIIDKAITRNKEIARKARQAAKK